MNNDQIYETLQFILMQLQSPRFAFPWRLEGSANLLIQGIHTKVNDLDLTITGDGVREFQARFLSYVQIARYEKKTAHLELEMPNAEVEINQYENPELMMLDKIEYISWKGLKLPILPLQYARDFYQKIGRMEKVRLIDDFYRQDR